MGFCFTVKRWPEGVSTEEVDFKGVRFWMQVHNLPITLLTVKNAEVIGRRLGRLIRVDEQWIKDGFGKGF